MYGKQFMLILTTEVLIEPIQKLETCCIITLQYAFGSISQKSLVMFTVSTLFSLPVTQQKALGTSKNVPKHEIPVQYCCFGYKTNCF